MLNFYRRFIPHCAATLQPLHDLLKHTNRPSDTLVWTDAATTAFADTKNALANASLLVHPTPDAPTCIMTDASDLAIGAVLQQYVDEKWCPIAFFSKALKPAERKYSTFDRELLAIYLAVKHFQYFLEGRQFHVLTDHKPLTYVLTTRSDKYTPRQVRHLDQISQYTTDIRHVEGANNSAADALSRIVVNALHTDDAFPVIDFRAMAVAQVNDPALAKLQSDSSLKLQQIPLALSNGVSIICDMLTGVPHPYVPESFRQTIFDCLHSLSHPGIRATQRMVTSRFVWPRCSQVGTLLPPMPAVQSSPPHDHTSLHVC